MPDGEITFNVSTTGITRVSFTNDRIRRVVHGETDFEMTNDEATGDVFMRFVGIDPPMKPDILSLSAVSPLAIPYCQKMNPFRQF